MAREIQDLLANDTARARCIDVIIVTYNSSEHVRRTVRPLTGLSDVQVIVVDNNSSDETLEAVMDLPIEVIPLESNVGFAAGCNIGWRRGSAPFVLFLNPDACIEADALCTLTSALASQQRVGAVGPLITDPERRLDFSQRRFPRLLSTWARALFLHRLAPGASWSDETIRDKKAYESAHSAEWLSGACLLVRRDLLEQIGGFDERYFMYSEDQDLCKAVWGAGREVRFDPVATCIHVGGASAPQPSLFPVAARSRLLYAQKHRGRAAFFLEWFGLILHSLTHAVASRGSGYRRGHRRTLAAVLRAPFRPNR